jgi:hypothetical protein
LIFYILCVFILLFTNLVQWISLLLLWKDLSSKQLSPKDLSLCVGLLCSIEFNSIWTAMVSEFGHSVYHIGVGASHLTRMGML